MGKSGNFGRRILVLSMEITNTYAILGSLAILIGGCIGSFEYAFPTRERLFAASLRGMGIGFLFSHLFPVITYALYNGRVTADLKPKLSLYFLILQLSYVLLRAFEEWMNAGNVSSLCCSNKGAEVKVEQHNCSYQWEFKEKPLHHLIVVLSFSICGAVWWTLECLLLEPDSIMLCYDFFILTVIMMVSHGFNCNTVGELQNFDRKSKWVYIGQPVVVVATPLLALLLKVCKVFSNISQLSIAYILAVIAAIVTAWMFQSVQSVTTYKNMYSEKVTRGNIAIYYLTLTSGIVSAFLISVAGNNKFFAKVVQNFLEWLSK